MARPTSAHILAAQLEQAQAGRPASQTPSPSSGQTSPSTPWLSDSYSTTTTSPMSSPEIGRRPPKLSSRPATARSREESEDADLEDELNDFGFGSTRKSKPKESLLDLLNSEPPAWMMEEQNVPPQLSPRKSNLLQKKMRLGSGRSSNGSAEDPTARFSTLRSFKSTSSILGSRRSKSSTKVNDQLDEDDDFGRSMALATKKLSAKDAAPSPTSTRDLADFLRTSAPPLDRSSSSRTRSSTSGSIETATTGSARIMRAVVSKVGSNGSRASLVRSNSGSSHNHLSIKEAVSPGAGSQFGDASLWRSNVLSPEGHEQEESLYESVSLRGSTSVRGLSNTSGRISSPSSPRPIPRSASQESSLTSFQLQRKASVVSAPPSSAMSPNRAKRLSRKPVPLADDLEGSSPTSSSSSKPLISKDTLRLLQQANEDDTGRFTVNESPIKGRRPATAPVKSNGHLDRASTMTFGPGLLSNGSNGNARPRSELIPPPSPGTSFASTSTSTSASRSPSDTDSPPSPRRARSTSASLDDSLINAAMAFANLGSRDHRLRHDDSSPQSKGAALRRFPSPPPDHPLPSRPLSTARPISASFPSSTRPVSISIHHPATFGASAARLSTLSDPDTIRRPPSVDSAIDPPLSGATSSEERFDGKDTIFVALRLLRRSMRATADLPIDTESLADEDDLGGMSKGRLEALLPTLKGLQNQMREAANLIEVVVRLAEKGPAPRNQEDVKGEEQAEAFVVERMLGGETEREEKQSEGTADVPVVSGLVIAEHETEEPFGEDDEEKERTKRRSTDEESLFSLLVNEIDEYVQEAPASLNLT